MVTVKFERVERDCPYNQRADIAQRDKIMDYNVLIDGEHRASFHRQNYARSRNEAWRLYDAEGAPIRLGKCAEYEAKHMGAPVAKIADFEPLIHEALEAGFIPTVDEQRAAKRARDCKTFLGEVARCFDIVAGQVQNAAGDLLSALISLNAALAAQAVGVPLPAETVAEWQRIADAAIAKAEGKS